MDTINAEELTEPIECFVCGSCHWHDENYGEMKERDVPAGEYPWFHDQCWVEFNVLNAWKEQAKQKAR